MSHATLRCLASFVAVLMAAATPVAAQTTASMVTDRPDFTESAVTVPTGALQIEAGLTYETRGGPEVLSGPEALIRWGVGRRFELRFLLPDYTFVESESGLEDAGIGVKVAAGSTRGWAFAGLASVTLPTGDDRFGSGRVVPGIVLVAGRSLGPDWSLGAQAMASWPRPEADPDLAATLVVSRPVTRGAAAFGEILLAESGTGQATVLLHHGYTIALGPLMQIDLHAAVGLTDESPDFLLGAGWSSRF